jgi:hypothetical protein
MESSNSELYRIELMKKIEIIVLQDLNIQNKEQMDRMNMRRFDKQCNRLLEACMICPQSEHYIMERYDEYITNSYKDIY